ncbi:MAG: alpha-amylase [Treponemataceae bacterium]|nr:alpha-amylase [Treponemataceae bacterium]
MFAHTTCSFVRKVAAGACLIACAGVLSAKPKKAKAVDPELAVTELAPVERKASKPTEGVYYSLFVRSFADSNKDGIGDFNGLVKKLDYLNDGDDLTTDDLGITGIWLLPIFESSSYHGYNVDDYYKINPEYGTMKDFENFLAECKKRGIDVIIDMTCNHSSSYNEWFLNSKNPDSPYRTWYRWISDDDSTERGGPYNLNQKIWGHKVWNVDLQNKGVAKDGSDLYYYYAAVFDSSMPDFNMDEQAARDEFKNVFKFWLDKGVSGFRFDAAGHIYNSVEVKPGTETLPKAVAFWKEMNDAVLAVNPDAYTVAEVWEPTATRARYMGGMMSNFHFDLGTLITNIINNQELNDKKSAPEDADKSTYNGFARSLESEYAMYAANNKNYIDAPFLSNHDQPRSSAALRNNVDKMKLAADMYILAEGVPFLYYGEEIGMKSGSDDPSKRTPMVWNAEGKDKLTPTWINSGAYGNAGVYNKKTVPVSVQQKDPDSLLNHYKRVIRVKTAHPALYRGRLKAVATDSPVLESWVMECDAEKAFVVHNVSSVKDVTVQLPEGCDMPLVYAANPAAKVENGMLTIPAMSSVVLAADK